MEISEGKAGANTQPQWGGGPSWPGKAPVLVIPPRINSRTFDRVGKGGDVLRSPCVHSLRWGTDMGCESEMGCGQEICREQDSANLSLGLCVCVFL